MHGVGTEAALQLREPQVLLDKGDGVLTSEGVLLQTPALPGAAGPHGYDRQPGPVPPDVPPGVKEATHTTRYTDTKPRSVAVHE